MTIGWHFNNTYSKLSDTFREKIKPIPVTSPELVIFNEGLLNVVQQYLKKGANVYVEGQLTTSKWKDESSGQDK